MMIASLTLLPAMLGFAGNDIDKFHLPRLLQTGGPPPPEWLLVPVEPLRPATGLGNRPVRGARAPRAALPLSACASASPTPATTRRH